MSLNASSEMVNPQAVEAIREAASRSSARLENWLGRNGWSGYDPYDMLGTGWGMALLHAESLPLRALRKVTFGFIHRFPLTTRRVARVRAINPKGMGLFVSAFCRLFEVTRDEAYLRLARECADWLLAHPSQGYPGLSWGYPFDWQSVVFIPKGTPSSVVSTAVGDGMWHLARLTGEEKYKNACLELCDFLLEGLNRTVFEGEALCFSYTPIDDFLVHNASLFTAEYLARIAHETGRPEWSDIATRAGNYALREQNEDGSIFYWGKAQNENAPNHLDCYHSGFEIRCLWGLWKATGDERFHQAALKYFKFFRAAYIGDDGAVMNLPGRVFPVDIHACAEALMCPAIIYEAAPEDCLSVISKVLPWVLRLMQNKDGSFAYMAFENGRVNRTPFIRWGQAWMIRALAEVQFILAQHQARALS
jgi:rhamnogalacturonyl hydrolase YesR